MNFDDVNYELYNKYILIDPKITDSHVEIKELKERGGFVPTKESYNNLLNADA